MNLDVLEYVVSHEPVKLVLSIANHHNPTGSVMPEESKRRMVEFLDRKGIPLLEDDIYGDISFSEGRPPSCKKYDLNGSVIHCSSLSKSVAPGLRLGWVAAGRWQDKLCRLKMMSSMGVSLPVQRMGLRFLSGGHYDRHLRLLKRRASERMGRLRRVVLDSFPAGTECSNPQGGYVLWITLKEGGDVRELYFKAKEEGIIFAPGNIFSLEERWNHCLRLGAGYFTEEQESHIRKLGKLVVQAGL